MFEDQILLKIKREYSKDESFALVLKKLSETQIENGILKSELAELKAENYNIRNSYKVNGLKTKKLWLKEDMFSELKEALEKQREKEIVLQKQLNEWRDNYFSLKAKNPN